MGRGNADAERLVRTATAGPEFSARVLLTTIFGDALLPRGVPVAVQSLVSLVQPFAINDRLVRTSLTRLTREELVRAERIGRQSFYRVADRALAIFGEANRRIYEAPDHDDEWDQAWTVAVLDTSDRSRGRQRTSAAELGWLGLTEASPGVFISPTVTPETVLGVVERSGGSLAALTRGELHAGTVADERNRANLFDPDGRLRAMHEAHRTRFQPFVSSKKSLHPADAFTVRTLLIDSWRRIALRSPQLPAALLPADWPAGDNHALTRAVHTACWAASETHLDDVVGAAVSETASLFV